MTATPIEQLKREALAGLGRLDATLANMPPLLVRIEWSNQNQMTVWNKLATRLGRQPTNAEATAEVKRILGEAAP